MKELIKNLYDQVVGMNAGEGHVTIEEVHHDPKATAVISVYHNQRPANLVLDELYQWAEENGLSAVVERIHLLERMD